MKLTKLSHPNLLSFISALALLTLSTKSALAGNEILQRGTDGYGNVTTPLANPNDSYGLLGGLVSTLITVVLVGAGATAFVFFIIGAIQWGHGWERRWCSQR